jgi:hypothetical protein
MYRGNADISIALYRVDAKDGERRVFSKEYMRTHPRSEIPIDSSTMPVAGYRRTFTGVIADDISKMFIACPPDDSHQME